MEYIDNFAFSQNSGVKIQSPVQVLFILPPPHPAFSQAIVRKLIIARIQLSVWEPLVQPFTEKLEFAKDGGVGGGRVGWV